MLSSRFTGPRRPIGVCLAIAALLLLAAPAQARNAYVANSGDDTVSVLDMAGGGVFANIPVGEQPVDIAIAPDGGRAYVANRGDGTVSVIDTATNTVVGPPIEVGAEPLGIAVTPDGSRIYVSNFADDTVLAIGAATGTPLAPPIPVGEGPEGIAISPDGRAVFVAQREGGISVIDPVTNSVVDSIEDGLGPSRLAIGPKGGRGFVTNRASSSVSAFNPVNHNLVGVPIATGTNPAGIAIDPSGAAAYAASPVDGSVTPIDTSLQSVLSLPIAGFPGATGIAFGPGGLDALVTDGEGSSLTALDATRNAPAGSTPVGAAPTGVAVVPDQGPSASFFVSPTRMRAKKRLTFHGAASSDSDGSIANYAWDFGDGGHAEGQAPTRVHRYRRPGLYQVTLVVTDDEGCSTEQVFTGQTAYCNGSPRAAATETIRVLSATGPRLRLRGPHRQRLRSRTRLNAHCVGKACSYRARGVVIASFERGGVIHRRLLRLGRSFVPRPSRGWRRLVLRLPGATRRGAARALRRGGKAKARLAVVAIDRDGDETLRTRKVKLVLR